MVEEIFSEKVTSTALNIPEAFAKISAYEILGSAVSVEGEFETFSRYFPARSTKVPFVYVRVGVVSVVPVLENFKRKTLSFALFPVSQEVGIQMEDMLKFPKTILESRILSLIVSFKASICPSADMSKVSMFWICGGVESISI